MWATRYYFWIPGSRRRKEGMDTGTTWAVSAIGKGSFVSCRSTMRRDFILTTFFLLCGNDAESDQEKATKRVRWKEMIPEKGPLVLSCGSSVSLLCGGFFEMHMLFHGDFLGRGDNRSACAENWMRELSTSHRTAKRSRNNRRDCHAMY